MSGSTTQLKSQGVSPEIHGGAQQFGDSYSIDGQIPLHSTIVSSSAPDEHSVLLATTSVSTVPSILSEVAVATGTTVDHTPSEDLSTLTVPLAETRNIVRTALELTLEAASRSDTAHNSSFPLESSSARIVAVSDLMKHGSELGVPEQVMLATIARAKLTQAQERREDKEREEVVKMGLPVSAPAEVVEIEKRIQFLLTQRGISPEKVASDAGELVSNPEKYGGRMRLGHLDLGRYSELALLFNAGGINWNSVKSNLWYAVPIVGWTDYSMTLQKLEGTSRKGEAILPMISRDTERPKSPALMALKDAAANEGCKLRFTIEDQGRSEGRYDWYKTWTIPSITVHLELPELKS